MRHLKLANMYKQVLKSAMVTTILNSSWATGNTLFPPIYSFSPHLCFSLQLLQQSTRLPNAQAGYWVSH